MKLRLKDSEGCSIASTVGPEDLRCGDYVAVLSQIVEVPSFMWDGALPSERDELVRVRRVPTDDRAPLKIEAICLPFVFVKQPDGTFETIDVRLVTLARLQKSYAKTVWKSLRPAAAKRRVGC